MNELRKIQHLDWLVLVEDRTMSASAILSLNNPSCDKKMGNPFFPSTVVPVDCLRNCCWCCWNVSVVVTYRSLGSTASQWQLSQSWRLKEVHQGSSMKEIPGWGWNKEIDVGFGTPCGTGEHFHSRGMMQVLVQCRTVCYETQLPMNISRQQMYWGHVWLLWTAWQMLPKNMSWGDIWKNITGDIW